MNNKIFFLFWILVNDNKFSTTTVEQQETESTTENQDEIEPSERDKAYFKEISILFGEDLADFGDGDLFNLCNISSEFEDKYDKIPAIVLNIF
jgi:hypothetical protein